MDYMMTRDGINGFVGALSIIIGVNIGILLVYFVKIFAEAEFAGEDFSLAMAKFTGEGFSLFTVIGLETLIMVLVALVLHFGITYWNWISGE